MSKPESTEDGRQGQRQDGTATTKALKERKSTEDGPQGQPQDETKITRARKERKSTDKAKNFPKRKRFARLQYGEA
jgi:hypothetical protein